MTTKRTWLTWWVIAEAIGVLLIVAWIFWPKGDGSSGAQGATAAPVTRDSSVRTADDVATGTQAEFDTLITDVRSLDSTIAVDLRYRDKNNFTDAPLPGYEGNRGLLRREAAAALARVQASLKADGLGLLVYDGYRPVRATEEMVKWTVRVHRENLVTDGYISDRSRHNLGVAIDCTLIDLRTREPLEMGTPYDSFSKDAHTANATGVAAANRVKFVAAMEREGFKNYEQEWWHFSYDVPAPSLRRFDIVIR
jgi:D-alanyl-D-alanine dipeptidase